MHELQPPQGMLARPLFAPLSFHASCAAVLNGDSLGTAFVDDPHCPSAGFVLSPEGTYLAGDTGNRPFCMDLEAYLGDPGRLRVPLQAGNPEQPRNHPLRPHRFIICLPQRSHLYSVGCACLLGSFFVASSSWLRVNLQSGYPSQPMKRPLRPHRFTSPLPQSGQDSPIGSGSRRAPRRASSTSHGDGSAPC